MSVLGLGDFSEQFDVAILVRASNEDTNNLQVCLRRLLTGTKVLACCCKSTNTDAEAWTNNVQRIESVERLLYAGSPQS